MARKMKRRLPAFFSSSAQCVKHLAPRSERSLGLPRSMPPIAFKISRSGSIRPNNIATYSRDLHPRAPHETEYDFGRRKRGAEMPKSKFSEAQIVAALRQVEVGRGAAE